MVGEQKTPSSANKQRASAPAPKKHTRNRLSLDQDQSARFLLVGGVVLILALAAGFIAFGYYTTVIQPRGRTVLEVDGEKVSYAAMKRRMNYELFQSASLQQDPSTLPDVAFASLVKELTLVSRGEESAGGLTPEEFEEAFRTRIGVSAEADQSLYQDGLRRQLDDTGLKESEFRRLVRAAAIETKLKEKFETELPLNQPHARIEVIAAPSQEVAQQAIDRINAGEAFAEVARDVSLETDASTTGGVHDFQPQGTFNSAYDDYAFSAEPGQLSSPLSAPTTSNVYVVRVIERADRPIAEEQKPTLAQNAFDEWLDTTRGVVVLVDTFDDGDRADALLAVYEKAQPQLAQQAQQQAEQQAQQQAAQQTAIAGLTAGPAPTTVLGTPGAGVASPPAQPPGAGATAPSQPVAPVP